MTNTVLHHAHHPSVILIRCSVGDYRVDLLKNIHWQVEFIRQAIVNQGMQGVQSILKIPLLLLIVFFHYSTM